MIELDSDGDGKVAGSVTPEGGGAETFSGWLELLRLLEPGSHGTDGVDPPAAGVTPTTDRS